MSNLQDPQDLLKVYAIERQDDSTALVLAFSMATAAFTYMIAAVVFLDGHHAATLLLLLAPLVPTAVACFLALNTAATLLRSVHLQGLEAGLRSSVPSATFHTDSGLVMHPAIDFKNPRKLWEPPRIRLAFTAINLVAYGIVYLSMMGFTAYMIYYAPWTSWTVVAAVTYGLVQIVLAFAVLVPLNSSSFQYHPSTEDAYSAHGASYGPTDSSDRADLDSAPTAPIAAEENKG